MLLEEMASPSMSPLFHLPLGSVPMWVAIEATGSRGTTTAAGLKETITGVLKSTYKYGSLFPLWIICVQ